MEIRDWVCERCGHEVPVSNRQVHEIRCARSARSIPRPPTPPRSPEPPDYPNVFTPTPNGPSPSATATAAVWREADLEAAVAAARATDAGRRPGTPTRAHSARALWHRRSAPGALERNQAPSWATTIARGRMMDDDACGSTSARGTAANGFGGGHGGGAMAQVEGDHAGGDRSVETRDQRESEVAGSQSQWACRACTFLNERGASSCAMCSTSVPAEERQPDATYRDTLINDIAATTGTADSHGQGSIVYPLTVASLMEAARERTLERSRYAARYTTSGGGVGGGAGGSTVSDAATGSAVGAIGAGLVSAMTPGNRPGHVIASMLQGALVGGVAGAAMGPEFRRSSADVRASREPGGHQMDMDELDFEDLDPSADYPRQPGQVPRPPQPPPAGNRSASSGARANAFRGEHTEVDLEVFMLAEYLRSIGMDRRADEIMHGVGMTEDEMMNAFWSSADRRRASRMSRRHILGGMVEERPADNRRNSRPATAGTVASLPEEVLTSGSVDRMPADERHCCICLENFGDGEVATRLPCLHLYHTVCIQNWLATSGTCPQCKHRVD